jgi:divalent metal cation (Fe/Co/Zn/Cd) transporter
LRQTLRKARRLEWLTIAYLISAVVLLALVLGSSQAMKTAWIEDLLSLIPPIAFLLAMRFNSRDPTGRFPYGFHRIVSIAHLCSALALFVMGTYLLVESIIKLITAEYPTINSIELFAALISLDITKDGVSNLRRAVVDLMDQTPTTIDEDNADPLRDRLAEMLQDLDWVEDVDLRLREDGQVYFGEALVVPSDSTNILEKVEDAIKRARDLDWRIYDPALTPVRELPEIVERSAEGERTA